MANIFCNDCEKFHNTNYCSDKYGEIPSAKIYYGIDYKEKLYEKDKYMLVKLNGFSEYFKCDYFFGLINHHYKYDLDGRTFYFYNGTGYSGSFYFRDGDNYYSLEDYLSVGGLYFSKKKYKSMENFIRNYFIFNGKDYLKSYYYIYNRNIYEKDKIYAIGEKFLFNNILYESKDLIYDNFYLIVNKRFYLKSEYFIVDGFLLEKSKYYGEEYFRKNYYIYEGNVYKFGLIYKIRDKFVFDGKIVDGVFKVNDGYDFKENYYFLGDSYYSKKDYFIVSGVPLLKSEYIDEENFNKRYLVYKNKIYPNNFFYKLKRKFKFLNF